MCIRISESNFCFALTIVSVNPARRDMLEQAHQVGMQQRLAPDQIGVEHPQLAAFVDPSEEDVIRDFILPLLQVLLLQLQDHLWQLLYRLLSLNPLEAETRLLKNLKQPSEEDEPLIPHDLP